MTRILDETIIAAALLHDNVEDTTLTSEEIAQAFRVDVATLGRRGN